MEMTYELDLERRVKFGENIPSRGSRVRGGVEVNGTFAGREQ